jgi:hypothetical protein
LGKHVVELGWGIEAGHPPGPHYGGDCENKLTMMMRALRRAVVTRLLLEDPAALPIADLSAALCAAQNTAAVITARLVAPRLASHVATASFNGRVPASDTALRLIRSASAIGWRCPDALPAASSPLLHAWSHIQLLPPNLTASEALEEQMRNIKRVLMVSSLQMLAKQ